MAKQRSKGVRAFHSAPPLPHSIPFVGKPTVFTEGDGAQLCIISMALCLTDVRDVQFRIVGTRQAWEALRGIVAPRVRRNPVLNWSRPWSCSC